MSTAQAVAVIMGASRGIGAALVQAFRTTGPAGPCPTSGPRQRAVSVIAKLDRPEEAPVKSLIVPALLALCVAPAAAQASKDPSDFNDAVHQGYEVVSVVGQGDRNQDHVIYMKKAGHLIVCGFRFVLTDNGFDERKSRTLGVCTGFQQ
jgi:hypothetical protein